MHSRLNSKQESAGMLKKRRYTKDNVVKVTFDLPPEAAHESVRLVGGLWLSKWLLRS